MEQIKTAYAWQEALELSKRLVEVCEAFSDAENNVLVWHLRQAVIDVPAGIAADLQAGRMATMDAVIKLAAGLELVSRIYPAIDGSDAEEQLEKVLQRMQSHDFAAREPEPVQESDEPENDKQPEAPVEPVAVARSVGSQPVNISVESSNE